jgi:hypothetical protein
MSLVEFEFNSSDMKLMKVVVISPSSHHIQSSFYNWYLLQWAVCAVKSQFQMMLQRPF